MRETNISMLKKDVQKLGKYYDLSLIYNFKYKDNFYPVEYEYYLDEDDLSYLIELIGSKFDIKLDGKTQDVISFLCDFADKLSSKEYEQVLWVLQDYLEDEYIHNILIKRCEEKAKEEFPEQFEYWVEEEDYPEYINTSDWEEIL